MNKLKNLWQRFSHGRMAMPAMQALPLREGRGWVTLPRLLVAVAIVVLAVIAVEVASPRVATMTLAALALLSLGLIEGLRRRRWERQAQVQLRRLSDDNLRLMRDIARQRQDIALMREALAGAGAAVSRQASPTDSAEQRMLRMIAQELSRLAAPAEAEDRDSILANASPLDLAIIEHHAKHGDSPARLTDAQVVQLIKAAVEQDRIDLFLQPIVTLPQRKERFVETLSRIRISADVYMPADRYVEVARRQDLLPAVDNLLLLKSLTSLRHAAEADRARVYFCNVTSLTLHDPKFMTDLVEFIAQNRNLAPRLVFELSQHDLATMRHDILPVLAGLAHLGCRFSMDQVRALNFSPEELSSRFVRFVKVEAAMLLQVLRGSGREKLLQFKAALDLEGIDLIVEKVEHDRELVELLDLGIDYGQGYLFGYPEREGGAPA